MPVTNSSAESNGESVRPSAFVMVDFSRRRSSPLHEYRRIFTPAAGLPRAVSSTCVDKQPIIFSSLGQDTRRGDARQYRYPLFRRLQLSCPMYDYWLQAEPQR